MQAERTMKKIWLSIILFSFSLGLNAQELVFPYQYKWNELNEDEELKFQVTAIDSVPPRLYRIDGIAESKIQFDSLGNFSWKPSFDFVDRLEGQKQISVIFEAEWDDGRKARKPVTFTVNHKNRAPVVEELPIFYVKLSSNNQYQISGDYVKDPDGDPLTFRSIHSQMPEGANLNSLGVLTWTPSRNQFNALRKNPLTIEFIVEDQPSKTEARGKIRIAQTQLDLPPEILLVPGDTVISIKEDELINLKIYVSDPNGDENIKEVGFVSSDIKVPSESFKENTKVQAEFVWLPGYEFVDGSELSKSVDLIFFTLDKSNNRTEKRIAVQVEDAENLDEKDKMLTVKYRNSLTQAKGLIDLLDENHETLTKAYKKAKKGKKNRALVTASLGATTGLSPIILSTDQSKVVSAVGGTTVLTLGTLEATEILGKSKSDILEKIKVNVEIRNQLQVAGDNFARKYALKSSRRSKEFDVDRDKMLPIINNQKLVILEMDASKPSYKVYSDKELKKTFPDFSEQ